MPLPFIAAILGRIGLATAARGAAARAATSGGLRKALAGKAYKATGSRKLHSLIARGEKGHYAHMQRPGASAGSAAGGRAGAALRKRRLADKDREHIDKSVHNETTTDNSRVDARTNVTNITTGMSSENESERATNKARVGEDLPKLNRNHRRALAKITLGATAAAGALVLAANKAHSFAEKISDGQRYLESYNAKIAFSFAQLEVDRVFRNIKKGQGTEATTEFLNTKLSRFENTLLPYQTAATNANNILGSGALMVLQGIIDKLEVIAVNMPMGDKIQAGLDALRADANKGIEDSTLGELYKVREQRARDEMMRQRRARQPGQRGI